MSIMEMYLALLKTPGTLALVYAAWILCWSYGIDRKKFVGIAVCVFFMVLSSLAGLL
ncbi:MAG: hypothetical protein RR740_08975 [Pseudomonas sp.]